jgi:maleate isomerase
MIAVLRRYGGIGRIGLVKPYMPVGDEQARRFFEDSGVAVARVRGLRCGSAVLIAHTPEAAIRDAIVEVDGPDADPVVVVGTNLPTGRVPQAARPQGKTPHHDTFLHRRLPRRGRVARPG